MKYVNTEYVSIDGTNITTARKVADAVKAFHLMASLTDQNFGHYRASECPALHVEVEIREQMNGRPDWAKEGA